MPCSRTWAIPRIDSITRLWLCALSGHMKGWTGRLSLSTVQDQYNILLSKYEPLKRTQDFESETYPSWTPSTSLKLRIAILT